MPGFKFALLGSHIKSTMRATFRIWIQAIEALLCLEREWCGLERKWCGTFVGASIYALVYFRLFWVICD